MESINYNYSPNGKHIGDVYREIEKSVPKSLDELEVKYNIDSRGDFFDHGEYSSIFKLGKGIVGKSTRGSIKTPSDNFQDLVKYYINQKTAYKTEIGHVPVPYGIFKIQDKETGNTVPMIVMEELVGKNIAKSFPFMESLEREEVLDLYSELEAKTTFYLNKFSDVCIRNAIWTPKEKKVRLIDTDFWKFKALQ